MGLVTGRIDRLAIPVIALERAPGGFQRRDDPLTYLGKVPFCGLHPLAGGRVPVLAHTRVDPNGKTASSLPLKVPYDWDGSGAIQSARTGVGCVIGHSVHFCLIPRAHSKNARPGGCPPWPHHTTEVVMPTWQRS